MKKSNFWAIMIAMVVSVLSVSSCTKEESDNQDEFVSEYVGVWVYDSEDDSSSDTMTLFSDGSLIFENEQFKQTGKFTVTDDKILSLNYLTYEEDGVKDNDAYTEFYYIISVSDKKLELSFLGDDDGYDLTLEEALNMTAEDGMVETFSKK